MFYDSDTLIAILGKNSGPLGLKVMEVLMGGDEKFYQQSIMDLCRTSADAEAVAKVFAAVATTTRPRAYWLGAAHLAFRKPLDFTPECLIGIAMGVFQAHQHLMECKIRDAEYEKSMPDIICEIVCSVHPQLMKVAVDQKTERRLGEVIKAWVRSKDGRMGGGETHIANLALYKISHRVYKYCTGPFSEPPFKTEDRRLSPLGNVVLEQLTYGYFATLSPLWRATVLGRLTEPYMKICQLKSGKSTR